MVDLNFLGLDMVDLNFLGPAGTDLKPYMSWEIKRFLLSAMDLDFFKSFFLYSLKPNIAISFLNMNMMIQI